MAESVRKAISAGDISPAIPKLLNDLLLLSKPTAAAESESTTAISKQPTKPAPSRKPRGAVSTANRAKQTTVATQSSSANDSSEQLSLKEKAILATQVINSTLKILSDVIKCPPPPRRLSSSKELLKSSKRNPLRRSSSVPQIPLQARSLNRVTSSPDISARRKRASSSASISSTHRPTAECARIAFACLRALQGSKVSSIDLPPLQIENGMLSLVGKLLSLGMEDLAIKELRILKKRLETKEKAPSKPIQKRGGKIPAAESAPQSLAQLLDFGDVVPSGPSRNLVITAQLHTLKLLVMSKNPAMTKAAIPSLQRSHPTSPTNLLLEAAKDSSQKTKTARQLENLSQLLLSLTPSVSSTEDILVTDEKLYTSPEDAIKLQQLALTNRILWWKLSDHRGDIEKDILDPFSRCMAAFGRRSETGPLAKYQYASESFESLMGDVSNYGSNLIKASNAAVSSMYKILGALAQEAGQLASAIQWTEKLQSDNQGKIQSDATCCAIASRLVALKLRMNPTDSSLEGLLLELLQHLEGPLKGDSGELDEMLTEVSLARRTAIGLISKRVPGSGKAAITDGIRDMCESLVFHCPRLLLRYLGPAPDNGAPKAVLRYEQRRKVAARSGFHALDSSLFLVRVYLTEKRLTWDLMDSVLQDCFMLLNVIDPESKPSSNDSPSASYYVRISHLYFTQHLNMKRDSQSTKDVHIMKALRRSIDVVRQRPSSEKAESLFISKLERLADAYKEFSRFDDAMETLFMLRDELVAQGVLASITQHAASQPLKAAWNINTEAFMLSRTLASILKLQLKKRTNNPFPDLISQDDWADETRGVVLEHILELLFSECMNPKYAEGIRNTASAIRTKVLELYSVEKFPVRRMRVQIRLLSNPIPGDVPDNTGTAHSVALESTTDSGLSRYFPHIQCLLQSMAALQAEEFDLSIAKSALASWHQILEKCDSFAALQDKIDDVHIWLDHLQSLSEYLEMKGIPNLRVAVCSLAAKATELLDPVVAPDDSVTAFAELGEQFLTLGYSGKAGLALHKSQGYADRNGVNIEASLHSHLLHAQYLLDIGNVDKCENKLQSAHALLEESAKSTHQSPLHFSSRVRKDLLIAHGSFVYSRLALERGSSQTALLHAKQSLNLVRRAWTITENQEKKLKASFVDSADSGVEGIGQGISKLNISISIPDDGANHESLNGPSFWILVGPLLRSLFHLSAVYEHNGMFRETLYYTEQAWKVAKAVRSDFHLAAALIMSGQISARAGNVEKAIEQLEEAKALVDIASPGQEAVRLHALQGYIHRLEDRRNDEQDSYQEALSVLSAITSPKYIHNLEHVVDKSTVELEEKMAELALEKPKPTRKPTVKRKAPPAKVAKVAKVTKAKATVKKVASRAKSPTPDTAAISDECSQLMSLKSTILRGGAEVRLFFKKWEESLASIKEAEAYSVSQSSIADQHVVLAKRLLGESIQRMTADPVFSVLQDSTISFPSVAHSKGERSAADRLSGARLSPPSKATSSKRSKSPVRNTFFDTLRQAQEHLSEAYSLAIQVSATSVVNLIAKLMSGIVVLLSTAGHAKGKASTHPVFASYGIEMSRIVALRRERFVIEAEHKLASGGADEDLSWSAKTSLDPKRSSTAFSTDLTHFQKDYVDIIPKAWTAISLSLSEDRSQLCLTKLQAEQSPFVVRLPLGRNETGDADEEPFDFEQGQAELLDIIKQANFSAHDTRNRDTKAAKTEWWNEREALDLRMKELLQNIENIWLGGFRGIFSQHPRRSDLLARFQRSFHNVLDKYLPSRQKKGRRNAKTSKIVLDSRILELFIGLGDASAEDADLDEPLTDLLYFVVDILQFHGEQNAYDEVDFDSMVVETLTALSCYHEQANALTSSGEHKHTILILDKSLHCFPWESLPCMDGLAVSRLPSLSCLRDRILEQKHRSADTNTLAGHYINHNSGAYILNPSSDLSITQKTFQKHLTALESWTGTINSPPTESLFTSNLQNKDLFLYFGHGSGAQYIRSKTIRRMEKCAVSFLMGCSSGEMIEAGEFEAYGTPVNYMLGGCPALVGTLWDVTDRDIDRFAEKCLIGWGLFDKGNVVEDTNTNGKGGTGAKKGKGRAKEKGKAASNEKENGKEMGMSDEAFGKISLVEAVAKGKKACTLRYLTAAAVCVWGVPVYLE